MSSNVAGTWKVRPMPSRACSSGGARVTSTPSNMMRPVVGSVSPARQLKKVDLPAPFGPIRPMISPSSIVEIGARDRAQAAEGLRDVLGAKQHRARACAHEAPLPATMRVPHVVQSARLEARDQHDDAAIEDVGQAGAAAAEPGVGRGLQRDQDDARRPAGRTACRRRRAPR